MIRLLTPKDTISYHHLRLHALRSDPKSWSSLYDFEQKLPLDCFTNKIRFNTKPPIFGVYGKFLAGKLIANIQLTREWLPKYAHIANLYELYVHPDHRRNGIARNLLNHILQQFQKSNLTNCNTPTPLQTSSIEQLHIRANSNNTPAINLYKKLGFVHQATHKNAVKEPDGTYQNELFFTLNLNEFKTPRSN